MSIIGEAFVKILGDTSGLPAEIKKDVGTAVTQAGKATQSQVRTAVKGAALQAAKVVAGGAALRRITSFLGDSIDAAAEAEQAQVRLQNAYAKFPALAGGNIESLNRLNVAMARRIRFDDDALAGAEAQLAMFKLNEDQIKELIPLIADFAARTGRDLPAASSSVAKAILGQGRALKEVGVDFIDLGNKTDNYNQLVKQLRRTVGGFAEEEGRSTAGRLEILSNQFGEIKETIGEGLLPALTAASGPLLTIVKGFLDLPAPVKNTVLAVAGLTIGAAALGLAINTVRTGLAGLGITFGEVTPAIAAETAAITANTVATEANAVAQTNANLATGTFAARGGKLTGLWKGLTTGIGGVTTVIGLAVVATDLWKKRLDEFNFSAVEQHKNIEAGIPLINAYTDATLAGKHTREDLVRTIRGQIQLAKDEGANLKELTDVANAGADALARYDSATQGANQSTAKTPAIARAAAEDLGRLQRALGNVTKELGLLNSMGVPAVLANQLVNNPAGSSIVQPSAIDPSLPPRTESAIAAPSVTVQLNGRTVEKHDRRSRVLLGGG